MNSRQTALALTLTLTLTVAALSCGGARSTQTIPTLPGDGSANTDKPHAVVEDRPTDEPWGDRDTLIRLPEQTELGKLKLPAIEAFKLKNGLEVLLIPDRTAPVASLQLAIKAGRDRAKRDTVGLARLTAVLTTRGTRARTAKAIVNTIESASGDLTADASYEATLLSCTAVASQIKACSSVLADMAANATFPNAAFEELRGRLRESSAQRVRDTSSLAAAHFQNALWGESHPRGWPTSPRSIGAIKRTDVLAWYRRYYRPNNAVLAVAGDFDNAAMKASIKKAFGRWAKASIPTHKPPAIAVQKGIRIRVVDKPDASVTQIRMGQLGLAEGGSDFAAAVVVDAVLGRLPVGSRLERALSGIGEISASSSLDSNAARGSWVISAAAPAKDAVAVVQRVRDAMSSLKSEGPSGEETRLAKSYAAGAYATRFQSASDVAGGVLAAKLHGHDSAHVEAYPDRIGAVTVAAAAKAAKSYLSPANLTAVFVGPAAQIVPALEKAGWKYEISSFVDPIAPWDRKASKEEARKIIASAIKAKGGEKALRGIKSIRLVGKSALAGDKRIAQVEKRFVVPSRLRLDMKVPSEKLTIITVMDGNVGWAVQDSPQGRQVIPFPAGEVAAGKAQVWRETDFVLLHGLEKGAEMTVVDEIKIEKKLAWAVRIISADRLNSIVLFVDKSSRMLLGMTYQERGQQGVVVGEERYGKYKAVKGIQIAHERTTQSGQVSLTTEITKAYINEAIDGSIFAKPAK